MSEDKFKNIKPFEITKDIPGFECQELSPGSQIAQTTSKHHVAISVPKPRNLKKIITEIIDEAIEAKHDFWWTWKVGDKWIEGGTIGLAQAMNRAWTNCALETECKEEFGQWVFRTHFIDFENGYTTMREHRVKIPIKSFGKYDMDRTLDMKFQSVQSKNQRNTIFAALPRWLKNQAIEAAKKASQDDSAFNMPDKIKKAIDYFADQGINEKELCAYFEKQDIKEFNVKDVARLRNLANQLYNKEIKAEDIISHGIYDFEKPKNNEAKKQKKAKEQENKTSKPVQNEIDIKGFTVRGIADYEIEAYFGVTLAELDCEQGRKDLFKILTDIEGGKLTPEEFKKTGAERFEMRQKE